MRNQTLKVNLKKSKNEPSKAPVPTKLNIDLIQISDGFFEELPFYKQVECAIKYREQKMSS